MRENFLHFVWKHKKFNVLQLKTVNNELIELISVGQHNHDAGPDFFNAKLKIANQLWAGNVEIHVKSSDWYLHGHETNKAYDNVILHVVYEHDTDIFRKDNSVIPTLQLKQYIDNKILQNYRELFSKHSKWIHCENDFSKTDDFVLAHWLERLYFERLEQKSKTIELLLQSSKSDWESVLFKMLMKNFGLKVNGDAFFSLANSLEFSVVKKSQSNAKLLEALFLGQAQLLETPIEDSYYQELKYEYQFLRQKFQIESDYVLPVQFFRLRPSNFPTIRLSQLAQLYHKEQNLFSKVIACNTIKDYYSLFRIQTSVYWKTHYTFQKESKESEKYLSHSFIDLLVINSIIPLKFCYFKHLGIDHNEKIIRLITSIRSEKNSIVDGFNKLKTVANSALESQALLQLKKEYCTKHLCLKCAIGNSLLA